MIPRVEDEGPFQVNANFVVVKGMMNIGTVDSPYEGKITFNLTNGGYEYTVPGNTSVGIKGFIVVSIFGSPFFSFLLQYLSTQFFCNFQLGGSVEFNGMYGNQEAWTTLTKTAAAGSKMLTVKGDVSKWPVNGNIAIASTDYDYTQAEERVIKAISYGKGLSWSSYNQPMVE